jgi:uncharacterized protein
MATYKTPGVYVEELATLPPSVAEVSTAIPAFLGYTEKAVSAEGKDLTNVPVRISTMLEYKKLFGGPDKSAFNVTTGTKDGVEVITGIEKKADNAHRLYYSLDHFFKNGGGSCYIVSLGGYGNPKLKADFTTGLEAIEREDEPTLLMLSEATTLTDKEYHDLCQEALDQCNELMDRFCIFDILNKPAGVENFRNGVSNYLKYGAAYMPYLETSITYQYEEKDVRIAQAAKPAPAPVAMNFSVTKEGLKVSYAGMSDDKPKLLLTTAGTDLVISETGTQLSIVGIGAGAKNVTAILTAWDTYKETNPTTKFTVEQNGAVTKVTGAADALDLAPATTIPAPTGDGSIGMDAIKDTKTTLYNALKLELNKFRVILPPSPAVAGVYASVDRDRGVWKAPANVGLNAVVAPMVKISEQEQENLNVHPDGGKSINAIRSFAGKGTLVWGARTLAGNDNEWRYVPVRRLFNMVEESARKASSFAVFEPNDATTWLKVKGMLESYLYGLWQQGALAGPKAEAAYFVNVGLGKTMTSQDILEGRMIIEIGIAAVRPAEFIILRFSHKLQEA